MNQSDDSVFVIRDGALHDYKGSEENVVVPDGVEVIWGHDYLDFSAFYWNEIVRSVVLPDSVYEIGVGAFMNCENLESISLSKNLTVIRRNAFWGCKSLKSITIPDSVVSIESGAFSRCSSLQHVELPNSLKSIPGGLFSECSSLEDVRLPKSIKCIPNSTFRDCSSLSSIDLPRKLIDIKEYAFSGCRALKNISLPESLIQIRKGAFEGCVGITSVTIPAGVEWINEDAFKGCPLSYFAVNNPDLVIGDRIFGDSFPEGLLPQIHELYPILVGKSLKQRNIWTQLRLEEQLDLFIRDNLKTADADYRICIQKDELEAFGNGFLSRLSESSTKEECKAAVNFIILFAKDAPAHVLRKIYSKLKTIKSGSRLVKKIETDLYLKTHVLSTDCSSREGNSSHPLEKLILDHIARLDPEKLVYYSGKISKGVKYADSDQLCPPEALVLILNEYDGQLPPNKKGISIKNYRSDRYFIRRSTLADTIASYLDRRALTEMLEKKSLVAYAALADETGVASLISNMNKWKNWSEYGVSGRQNIVIARGALLLNQTRAAMIYCDKNGMIDEYARLRKMDLDTLRDKVMSDFGLDLNGKKVLDLGNTRAEVSLNDDLTLSVTNLSSGKIGKSIPKINSDPEKYEVANRSFSEMKKNIKKVTKNRIDNLFAAFLDGTEIKADTWKNAYIDNPVLNRIARLLVWKQDATCFTLDGITPVDCNGARVTLSGSSIYVAHPMEMLPDEVKLWQKYFTSHGLKQLFPQIWEPVRLATEVQPNRFAECYIPYYRFVNREKHGITVVDEDFHNSIFIQLRDCQCDIERIDIRRHEIKKDDRFRVNVFSFREYTRMVNHHVAYLDRITVWERIRADDPSVMDIMQSFTIAQVMEFIKIAQEANSLNVLPLLIEFNNNQFSDFDPMEEFTLE